MKKQKPMLPKFVLEQLHAKVRVNRVTTKITTKRLQEIISDWRGKGLVIYWSKFDGTYRLHPSSIELATSILAQNIGREVCYMKAHPRWEWLKTKREDILIRMLFIFVLALSVFLGSVIAINYFIPLNF